MNATHKKQLKAILEQLNNSLSMVETFAEEHQEWMDEHDYGWEETPSGERAQSEQYELDDAQTSLESMIENLQDIVDGNN